MQKQSPGKSPVKRGKGYIDDCFEGTSFWYENWHLDDETLLKLMNCSDDVIKDFVGGDFKNFDRWYFRQQLMLIQRKSQDPNEEQREMFRSQNRLPRENYDGLCLEFTEFLYERKFINADLLYRAFKFTKQEFVEFQMADFDEEISEKTVAILEEIQFFMKLEDYQQAKYLLPTIDMRKVDEIISWGVSSRIYLPNWDLMTTSELDKKKEEVVGKLNSFSEEFPNKLKAISNRMLDSSTVFLHQKVEERETRGQEVGKKFKRMHYWMQLDKLEQLLLIMSDLPDFYLRFASLNPWGEYYERDRDKPHENYPYNRLNRRVPTIAALHKWRNRWHFTMDDVAKLFSGDLADVAALLKGTPTFQPKRELLKQVSTLMILDDLREIVTRDQVEFLDVFNSRNSVDVDLNERERGEVAIVNQQEYKKVVDEMNYFLKMVDIELNDKRFPELVLECDKDLFFAFCNKRLDFVHGKQIAFKAYEFLTFPRDKKMRRLLRAYRGKSRHVPMYTFLTMEKVLTILDAPPPAYIDVQDVVDGLKARCGTLDAVPRHFRNDLLKCDELTLNKVEDLDWRMIRDEKRSVVRAYNYLKLTENDKKRVQEFPYYYYMSSTDQPTTLTPNEKTEVNKRLVSEETIIEIARVTNLPFYAIFEWLNTPNFPR